MNRKNQQQFKPVDAIVKFLVGIAGIAAGVSALLSVSGFLLLRSHANMLGISSVLHHSVGDYLYEGGVFFISALLWALPASIIGNIYGWIGMGIIAVYLLGKRFRVVADLYGRTTKFLKLRETFQYAWIRWVYIVFAVFILLLFIGQMLPSSEAKDLLFPAGSQQEIAKRVNEKAIEGLKNQYVDTVLYVVLSGIILWGIHRIHKDAEEKLSSIGRLFLYLLFVIQLVLLPVNYGQTVYSSDFHKVTELILDNNLQGKFPRSENIWLLNKNDSEFVFYSGDTQEVFLVQKRHVLNIAAKERANIFRVK